jgi:hypothetical protein
MNTEATLLTDNLKTPKRALALKLGLAICGLTALVAALASGPQAEPTLASHATVEPSGVSLEVSETADALCGCDLQTCCDNGFTGKSDGAATASAAGAALLGLAAHLV